MAALQRLCGCIGATPEKVAVDGAKVLIEYGLGGSVSTSCDVYSYGIMLMETFTGKKPTDEMFAGQMSLKIWVKESLPSAVIQVLDKNLLTRGGKNSLAKVDCVSSILKLALDCAAESSEQRINMTYVLATLKKIKVVLRNPPKQRANVNNFLARQEKPELSLWRVRRSEMSEATLRMIHYK
ncbi:hypothetical protein RJ640_029211 [Escallonia rubra]|uniref:Serine-threonine/tyrosine-protein kinase catalytic domain-containing protein n=1 Tax=Escallonia rubra TaxID=112253 RepID=A0AA88QSA6_9ASTE|nr:hypothetical protein RJ640_029211 [Escallonia rubra]